MDIVTALVIGFLIGSFKKELKECVFFVYKDLTKKEMK